MWECEYSDWLSVLPSTPATVTVEPVLPGADCDPCEPPRWTQVVADDGDPTAGSSSSSLRRAPGRAEDFVRGSVANTPFTPGGETTLTAAAAASAKEALHQAARTEWLQEVRGRSVRERVVCAGLRGAFASRTRGVPAEALASYAPNWAGGCVREISGGFVRNYV